MSIDALQTAANKISKNNIQASYIDTRAEGIVKTEDKIFSRMNDEGIVSGQAVINSCDGDKVTAGSYANALGMNSSEEMNSATNEAKTPQRPQDLIDQVSFGVAKVNVKSSAQYRKSYAFKIWKEKGCFPYRLADEPSIEERKKSKKYLNAMKAQRDRQNEEAWRAYKNFRVTNRTKTSQRPVQRVDKEMNITNKRKEHCPRQSSFSVSNEGFTKENIANQNSIPQYFKAKKDVSLKCFATPVCKSIPTSVIHINSTKSCENFGLFARAQRGSTKGGTEFRRKNVPQSDARKSSGGETDPRRMNVSADKESADHHKDNLIQWYHRETTSGVSDKAFDQQVQISESAKAENLEQTAVTTITSTNEPNNKRFLCRSTSSAGDILQFHGQKGAASSITKSESHLNLNGKSSSLTNEYEKRSHQGAENTDHIAMSGKEHVGSSVTATLQGIVQDKGQERDGKSLPSNSSSLAAAMKNTLNNKHCKENVKPKPPPIRARKRKSECTNEEGEPQRGKGKQEKSTVFTRLDEAVAVNLADGIHNVNSEYFPIDALANKAAKETSKQINTKQNQPTKMCIKNKVEEIDRAR